MRAFFAKYLRDDSVDAYSLRTSDNALVTSFQVLMDYEGTLLFTQSMHLPVCSACDWDEISTARLKINLIEMSAEEFLGCEWTLTETAKALKDRLADIELGNSSKYFSRNVEKCDLEKIMDDKCQIEPMRKCLYLMSRHPFYEGMVDSLLNLLFRELGMYSGMLFPIPQHSLSLQYGGGVNMTAKADFAIVDALSFCRMVVAKDRNVRGSIVNSFPQLIAESIAAIQNNLEVETSCKRKWEQLDDYRPAAMWGLRVSYHYFFF